MIYLTNIYKKILLIIFFSLFILSAEALNNKIAYKINNQIVTNFDITKEFRYLAIINPKLLDLTKDEIFKISTNSIIKEKIKKIEILNHVKEIKLNEDYMNLLLSQNYERFRVENKTEFEKKINSIGFDLSEFKEKMSIEALWNQIIYEKYLDQVKINKDLLKDEVLKSEEKSEYNLSEIVFEADNKENFVKKLKLIKNEISNRGFENAALLHSISDSKSSGGELGWINETSINKNLNNKVKKLKIGEYTEPEVIPGGFLILKLNKIKKTKVSINIDNELNKLIQLKTNQQLNQFSSIYYNKIKKNIKIEKI